MKAGAQFGCCIIMDEETKTDQSLLKERYFELTCSLLQKKCLELQTKNNSLFEHMYQLQKVVKRGQRKRALLIKRLHLHGDKLRMSKLKFMLDDRSDPAMVEISDFIKRKQLVEKTASNNPATKQDKEFKPVVTEKTNVTSTLMQSSDLVISEKPTGS